MNQSIHYTIAQSNDELTQILSLQNANLPQNLPPNEIKQEGFVTIQHDRSLLSKIAGSYAHIIAKNDKDVIAYALVMERACSGEIPVLIPMFEQIEQIIYNGTPLKNARFFVMGQVCIQKGFRGSGIFKGLYDELKNRMYSDFDYIITDISTRNKRSLKAHKKIGFQAIKEYQLDGEGWVIVLLEISKE